MIVSVPPFSPLAAANLQADYIHVWLLDVSQLTEQQLTPYVDLLNTSERLKSQTIKYNKKTQLASRILLRKALAYYTKQLPQDLQFERTTEGKPFLINLPNPVYFNISHSRNFVALVVCNYAKAGIDVEIMRPRNFLKIAEYYFHPREIIQLLACSENHREALFYRFWTLKEALFKATGRGIASGLAKVDFYFHGTEIGAEFSEDLDLSLREWQFFQRQISSKCFCALAINSKKNTLLQWIDGNYFFDPHAK